MAYKKMIVGVILLSSSLGALVPMSDLRAGVPSDIQESYDCLLKEKVPIEEEKRPLFFSLKMNWLESISSTASDDMNELFFSIKKTGEKNFSRKENNEKRKKLTFFSCSS